MKKGFAANMLKQNIELPDLTSPIANYSPYVITDRLVYISGQLPVLKGELKFKGKIGKEISISEGQSAARICALNLVAHLHAACKNDLDRLSRVVKLGGLINSSPTFVDLAKIMDGASNQMYEIFGNYGKHTRSTIGCISLPLGAPIEIDGVFELEPN